MTAGQVNNVNKVAQVFNSESNPNADQYNGWTNIQNPLIQNDKTYATSTFTKKKYIKKYKEKKVKDKKGKETTVKEPVYDYKYICPWTASAHQYGLKVPKLSYVKEITFRVRMKSDSGFTCYAPAGKFCIYGKARTERYNDPSDSTGYHNGLFIRYLNKKVSSKWETYEYTMKEADIKKGGFDYNDWNASNMGIDLIFSDPEIKGETNSKIDKHIYIAWVDIKIQYYTPTYGIEIVDDIAYYKGQLNPAWAEGDVISIDNELATMPQLGINENVTITATFKHHIDTSTKQVLDVDLPDGMEIVRSKAQNSLFDANTLKWTVDCASPKPHTLTMVVRSHRSGVNLITIGNTTVSKRHKLNVVRGIFGGYEKIILSKSDTPHLNHKCCLGVDITGYTEQGTIDEDDGIEYSELKYTISFNNEVDSGQWSWSVVDGEAGNISIISRNYHAVLLKVPTGEFHATLNFCFYPKAQNYEAVVTSNTLGDTGYLNFNVKTPYIYHITSEKKKNTNSIFYYGIGTDVVTISDHRMLTNVDVSTTSIESRSDLIDSNMVMSGSTLTMHKQDELDYIGCVPLEHLHFDPKSTFKDTLLNNSYKNKKYMGKKLAPDEDITLNVRLHPQQVTTIQGLIEMDKPIPINANHRCFEGDALNHRGWVEIYSIKAEETNPHWYKCDIDVKYLTHNLNTRFKIDKGTTRVYNRSKIKSLMAERVESGSKLDDSTTDTPFFDVDTDGSYVYSTDISNTSEFLDENDEPVINLGDNTTVTYHDDEGEALPVNGLDNVINYIKTFGYEVPEPVLNEPIMIVDNIEVPNNQRNMFNIGEGQHIRIRSKETLGSESIVRFEWLSTLFSEDKENNIRRFIRLIDKKTNDVVFEYEYTDFEYDDENITCSTVARVKSGTGWLPTSGGTDVDMRIFTQASNDYDEDDTDVDDSSEILYGSTLELAIDGNKLSLIDEGFNSMEYTLDVDLVKGDYYWETYWLNDNQDGETDEAICYFDITVASTLMTSQYANQYKKLFVSPFPVRDKNLLFTRDGEEGTIYYMEDDGEEFSYVMNPYYQYMNGTDLVTSDGISIFNLNYGYQIVYIQNGLVRLGFNRLNGRLYLGKFDPITREYVDTHRFHLKKYDDFNVNTITDDKIEIQASDSIFTIWRGHPYIMVKHPTEHLWIDSRFNRVWAEQVGDSDPLDLPTNWDLMNDKNLLPECVGGTDGIKSSCMEVEEVELLSKDDATLEWGRIDWVSRNKKTGAVIEEGTFQNFEEAEFLTGVEYTFYIDGDTTKQSDSIVLGTYTGNLGEYVSEVSIDNTAPYKIDLIAQKDIIQATQTDDLQASVLDYDGKGIEGKTVYFYEAYEPRLELKGDKSIIQTNDPVDLTTRLVDSQDGSIIKEQGRTIYYYEKID